jgi:hypothetical protein
MAKVLNGKVWVLDTVAGLVTEGPLAIDSIHVTFTTAAAGSCVFTTGSESISLSTANTIMNYATTAASTAAVTDLTKIVYYNGMTVNGLRLLTSVQITPPILVVTK